jgi:hypothetical protein
VGHDQVVVTAQGLHGCIESGALGLERAAARRQHLIGMIAHVGSGFGAQPAYVLGELTARPRGGVRVDDASVIAEDEHADAPPTEAGAGEQASREQFDVVTVGADEEDPFSEVHAGFRAT